MTDPYKVLGVTRDASDDSIKEAYRELVKKYHPDNYQEAHIKKLVEEKMKEINEAYNEIQKQRASGSNAGFDDEYDTKYSYSNESSSADFRVIRNLINNGNIFEAEAKLNNIDSSSRNAEWNYLMGCVQIEKGYYYDAQKYIQTALYMDPNNMEYQQMLNKLKDQTNQFGNAYRTSNNRTDNCSTCDICQGLLCADCLCECMGGDLISCC